MDPAVIWSPDFGQIFNAILPGNFNGIGAEQIFSQPLVFTGNDGVQYVYVATTQNNLYKLNAKTGAIVASRSLHVPFLTTDLDGAIASFHLKTIGLTLRRLRGYQSDCRCDSDRHNRSCNRFVFCLLAHLYSRLSFSRHLVSHKQDLLRSIPVW